MHFALILVFLAVWFFVLWLGSIALEATGMERSKARFQALSALTGTGFTTTEAESVVNPPRRRRIASWLILLGNAGVIAFIIVVILWIQTALTELSLTQVLALVLSLFVLVLVLWLLSTRRVSNYVVTVIRRSSYLASDSSTDETLHQAGDYSIVRLDTGRKAAEVGSKIKDTNLSEQGIKILAIIRDDELQPQPGVEETLLAGDRLLCYGKTAVINSLINSREV